MKRLKKAMLMPWAGGSPGALGPFANPIATSLAFAYDGRDGLAAYGNGAAISSWADQSGNGRTAVQAIGGQQPTKTTLNGIAAALFDATDDALVAAGWTLTQPTTIFAVAGPFTGQNLYDSALTSARNALIQNTGNMQFFAGGATVAAGAAPTGATSLWTVIFNGASSIARKNGVQVGAGNPGANSMTGITIGNRFSVNQGYAGSIACVLGYNAALSGADYAAVEAYLNARYGGPF